MNRKLNLMLVLELGNQIMSEVRGFKELDQFGASSEDKIVLIRDHAQEFVDAVGNLPLRSVDSHLITSLLSAGEVDLAVVLLLELINLRKTSKKLTVIETVDIDDLRSILGILP